MQNDFIHNEGAYGRAGRWLPSNRAVIENLIKLTDTFREHGQFIISAQFTIIANKDNKALLPDGQKEKLPFLIRGDFQQGRWGHQLIDELGPADYTINRIFSSAFKMTHLEWLLSKLGAKRLFVAGLNIDNSMFATLKSAKKKGFECALISNAWNAHDEKEALLKSVQELGVASHATQDVLATIGSK